MIMEQRQCPKCNEPLSQEANFCPRCGTHLSKCPNCSATIEKDVHFCAHCGAKLAWKSPLHTENSVGNPSQAQTSQLADVQALTEKWLQTKMSKFILKTLPKIKLFSMLGLFTLGSILLLCTITPVAQFIAIWDSPLHAFFGYAGFFCFFLMPIIAWIYDFFVKILFPYSTQRFLIAEKANCKELVKTITRSTQMPLRPLYSHIKLAAATHSPELLLQGALTVLNPTLQERNVGWFIVQIIVSFIFTTSIFWILAVFLQGPLTEFDYMFLVLLFFSAIFFFIVRGSYRRHVTNIMRETANTTNF